jgi:tetratricopeptide (TPR) repeat protein
MRRRGISCIFLCFTFSLCSWGQKDISDSSPNAPLPNPSSPEETLGRIFLSGKVVVDDGTVLTEPAEIHTICKGQKHTETYTDAHGDFSFEFDNRLSTLTGGQVDADASADANRSRSDNRRDLHECELQASLSGFSSQVIQLSSRLSGPGSGNLGRIVLHRLSPTEGLTVSATSALAPAAAKKAFEKGTEQEKKQKLEEAQQSFEKAVLIYPQYAEAWFELGRVQSWRNDNAGAEQSFTKSLAGDPNYVNPYRGLAELAMEQKNWVQLADITNRLLARYPDFFADAWFRNALANYNLQNFETAEHSARQGLKLDVAHQIPKMQYLLGLILIQRRNYGEAEALMQQYLQTASKPADIDDAQRRLAEIAKLSQAGTSAFGPDKQ